MKYRKRIWTAIWLTAMLALVLSGCGETAKEPDPAGPEESEIKRAVLVISGNLGDKGFSDLAYAGLQRAETELGLQIKVVELGGDNTKQIPVLTEFAEDPEWDLIVAGTYGMKESIQKVAEEHPDARFLVYDAQMDYENGNLKNVCSMENRQYEASFLAGALAASMTGSGMEHTNQEKLVGFVGGGENISINDFLVGYIHITTDDHRFAFIQGEEI